MLAGRAARVRNLVLLVPCGAEVAKLNGEFCTCTDCRFGWKRHLLSAYAISAARGATCGGPSGPRDPARLLDLSDDFHLHQARVVQAAAPEYRAKLVAAFL